MTTQRIAGIAALAVGIAKSCVVLTNADVGPGTSHAPTLASGSPTSNRT